MFPVALKRLVAFVYHRECLLCFGVDTEVGSSFEPRYSLRETDREVIEKAASQNLGDSSTMEYLERATERLAGGSVPGYALCSPEGEFFSFGWILPCDGYHVEEFGIHVEGRRLLILDCYTPLQHRGNRYYTTSLKLVVQKYLEQKNQLLILTSDRNLPSLRGIRNAGFVQKSVFKSTIVFGRWRYASSSI